MVSICGNRRRVLDEFQRTCKKYGIVPAEIMTETFQSSNTEEMNNRLNHYLRKNQRRDKKGSFGGTKYREYCRNKRAGTEKDFYFLCRCYGCPPDTFTYTLEDEKQKKQYTPKTFYYDFVGEFLDQFVNIISAL